MSESRMSCWSDIDGNVHVKAFISKDDLPELQSDPVARVILSKGASTASDWCLLMEAIFHSNATTQSKEKA